MNYKLMTLFLLLISLFACTGDDPGPGNGAYTYTASDEDFPNPERGFYVYSETHSDNYEVLSASELTAYRQEHQASGGIYKVFSTLVFRYFVLDDFKDAPISQTYLDNVQKDFDAAREAGVKLIVRFAYTLESNAGDCPEDFICPPYGDAPKEIVLQHIEQLGPVITENADVIECLQMGFIGTWGENYYTDYFGDASPNADQGKLLDENWQDRIDVLQALLDATPDELMIQVRYPQIKQRFIYGIEAPVTSEPLTESEAFTGSDKARIAFHNDCLFASADDFGTYEDYGNSSSPRKTAVTPMKDYFKADSKYVIVGGETCYDGYSPQNDCSPTGMADSDLRELHYTFLNSEYNNEVNNDWEVGGCMEEIKRNLGYRLVLQNASFPQNLAAGDPLPVTISLTNVGYASPVKERPVRLVLRNDKDHSQTTFDFATDIRLWFNEVTLEKTFTLPDNLEPGTYSVFLWLPDGHSSLENMPAYSIRLANDGVWEETLGYNFLQGEIEVE